MPTPPTSSGVPPLVLVTGPEQVLADRAVSATLDALRAHDPEIEVVRLEAAGYEAGVLGQQAGPSLFGGAKALVVRDADEAGEALVADLLAHLAFLAGPAEPEELTLIVAHKGGNRATKVLEAMRQAGARVLQAPAIKSDRDKSEFTLNEFRRRGREITPDGVRALVEAVGRSISELASACSQLIDDTQGVVDEDVVARYHGGRIEATGFRVADAALAGNATEALRLLRHALAGDLDPVPIVAVLAAQLRQLVKVSGAGRGSSGQLARALGMAPWQVDKARRSLRGWEDQALGLAVQAVAQADFDVKGGSRDPVYAVERAILTVSRARHVP